MVNRQDKFNKKCDNPYCTNQVIRISQKINKKFCKICKYAYDEGYRRGTTKRINDARKIINKDNKIIEENDLSIYGVNDI